MYIFGEPNFLSTSGQAGGKKAEMDIPAKLKHLMRNFCYFAVFSSEINIKLTTEVALQVQRHTQHSIFL